MSCRQCCHCVVAIDRLWDKRVRISDMEYRRDRLRLGQLCACPSVGCRMNELFSFYAVNQLATVCDGA